MMTTLSLLPWRHTMQQHPESWPRPAKAALILLALATPFTVGWLLYVSPARIALEQQARHETQQKTLFLQKLQQTTQLIPMRSRHRLLQQEIETLQQQLLYKSDQISPLLSEIASIAASHHLVLELARPLPPTSPVHPATPTAPDAYLTLPVHLRLRGRYHDIGRFAAALANSDRALVLDELHLRADLHKHGQLQLEVQLLRYQQRPPEHTP